MHKIIFVDQCLGGGGAERVLCTIMRALDPLKFEIHLILVTELHELKHLVPAYVQVHELGIVNTRKSLFSYRNIIREIRPDTVFSTTARITVLTVLGRMLNGSHRLIARYPNMPSRQVASGELASWRRWITKKVYRYADVVIAQSDEMAVELKGYFKLAERQVKTIANPIDRLFISQSLDGQASPFDFDKINLVASGRLTTQKGFDVLIQAFACLPEKHGVILHFLGTDFGGERKNLEELAEGLGVLDKIRFHGFVVNPYPYYKFCDLFVLSSRWEGCPNVLLECIYLGTRVAATRCVPIIDRLVTRSQGVLAENNNPQSLANAIAESLLLDKSRVRGSDDYDSISDFITILSTGCPG